VNEPLSNSVLVVLGHGATRNENSAAPVFQHAAELRGRGIFAEVREAFWKQEPRIQTVLAGLSAPRIFIVPLFISEGWFAGRVIPRALGFGEGATLQAGPSTLHYCRPAGSHERMTGVIASRAAEIVRQFPFPRAPKPSEITLFIAGHGTEKDPNSRQPIERQAGLIRSQHLYASVHAIFLEEPPRIADCYALAQTRQIVIVPFFISDGLHTQKDIPVLLGEPERIVEQRLAGGRPAWRNPTERNGRLVWYAPAVGSDPGIADVILESAREAAK